ADDLPAAGSLEVRTAAETTTADPIALAPGETGALEREVAFEEAGEHELRVGEASTTVTVGGLRSRLESMPGFGAAGAAVGLALALAVAFAISVAGRGRRR
ncbi:hypothetical protein C493_12042, partial [Natronolimnohabitans innermongolicus JCM 12255]